MNRYSKLFWSYLIIPLIAGMSLVLALTHVAGTAVNAFAESRSESLNSETSALVQVSAERLEQASVGLAAFWKSSQVVDAEEFKSYASTVMEDLPGAVSMRWHDAEGNLVYEYGTEQYSWNSLSPEVRAYLSEEIRGSGETGKLSASQPFATAGGNSAIMVTYPAVSDRLVGYAVVTAKSTSLTDLASSILRQYDASVILLHDGTAVNSNRNTSCLYAANDSNPNGSSPCPDDFMVELAEWPTSKLMIGSSAWSVVTITNSSRNWLALGLLLAFGTLFSLLISFLWASLKVEQRQLEDNAEREKTFVSLVSHQLREPLTQLSWGCDSLLDDVHLDENHREQVKELRGMLRRATKMVSDLLNVSRLERGILKMDLDEIPLATIIDDVLAALKPMADERESSILTDISPEIHIYADRIKTGEALRNIIDNAIKYGPRGGLIELKAETDEDHTILTVTDHGPGIPDELIDSLFEKSTAFRRQKNHKSTGLGLFLSKMFIEAQGGTLSFDTSHLGTVFVITMPNKMTESEK